MPNDAVALYNARLKESEERRARYEERVDAYHHSLALIDGGRWALAIIEPTRVAPRFVPVNSSPVQYFYSWLRRNAVMFTARLRSG